MLLDQVVDGYFIATDKSEDELEDLEERIFAEELPDARNIQEELFDIRRRLMVFRRAVAPLREVVTSILRKDVPWVDESTLTNMQDVYDHVFYLPIEFPIVLDGLRPDDPGFQADIDRRIRHLLETADVSFHALTGSVGDRQEQVRKVVGARV